LLHGQSDFEFVLLERGYTMKGEKTRNKSRVLFGLGLFLMVLLVSCEDITGFFSKSWGSNLERDLGKLLPPITTKNALALANDTVGDPKRAKLVAEKILEALAKTTDPAEKAVFLNAGLIAANNASNLITVMLGNIDTFSDPKVDMGTVLEKVQAAGNVQANADLISRMLTAAADDTGHVALTGISQDNLVLGAVTLLLADAQENKYFDPDGQKEYLSEFADNRVKPDKLLTDKQKKALTLSAAAGNQTGALNEVLVVLNLE
jgi:hypothetical protein